MEIKMSKDPMDLLANLVRLLASDNEGERLGAVAAMERILRRFDLTFNDVAETMAAGLWEFIEKRTHAKGFGFGGRLM
jgi:hypothetical protein